MTFWTRRPTVFKRLGIVGLAFGLWTIVGSTTVRAAQGCPQPTTASSEIVLGGLIGVVGPWGDIVATALCAAAADHGIRLELRMHDRDLQREQEFIEEFIALQIDALIMVAKLEDASTSLVRRAVQSGIQVVCLSGCLPPQQRERYISLFFESDNVELGYRSGAYLAHWVHSNRGRLRLNRRGQVKIGTIHADMSNVAYSRGQGFDAALEDMGLEWVEAVSLEADTEVKAARAVRRIVEEHPDVQLIWSDNAENTIGALSELQRLQSPLQRFLFGTEMNPMSAVALTDEDDILQSISTQVTYDMSYQAVIETLELAESLDENPETKLPYQYRIMPSWLYVREDPAAVEAYREQARARGLDRLPQFATDRLEDRRE